MGEPWLAAVVSRYGDPVTVSASRPLAGGYVARDVRLIELLVAGEPVAVVWKLCSAREVAALRAVAEVPGIGRPPLLADGCGPLLAGGCQDDGCAPLLAGGCQDDGCADDGCADDRPWVLMPHHPGTPLVAGQLVPERVYEVLARVHARYLVRPPPWLPVVDAASLRRLCLAVARPAVRGAADRAADRAGDRAADRAGDRADTRGEGAARTYALAEAALLAWACDERMLAALTVLPATLAHGDLHRGNILFDTGQPSGADAAVSGSSGADAADADRTAIIDWGNARIAPGGLDLAVLAEQGGVDEDRYHRRLAELTGRPASPELRAVERQWALAMGYVQYLSFAADHLGADRVGEMIDLAASAFERLGPTLTRL
ncbi:MAG: phosphotransferase family protein [Pseudonocardia sp.]